MMQRNLCLLMLGLLVAAPTGAQTVIEAETVHTMDGEPIHDGVILIEDDEIRAVGPAGEVTVPEGAETFQAVAATPGLIDARTSVGLAGILGIQHDSDEIDRADPIQASLRSLDAYNAREDLVAWQRDLGVTTVHTGPAPAALVSGQSLIAQTRGNTVDEARLQDPHAVLFSLGSAVRHTFETPGTRPKGAEMLRQALVSAEEADDAGGADLGQQVLADVVAGEIPAVIHADTAVDIMTALRLAGEFDLDLILAGAADAHKLIDEIAAAGIPVLLHPTMIRPGGDQANAAFDTAARLAEADIPFAITGGYEGYVPRSRVVLFEAAVAAANGLGPEGGLAAITRQPAEILGLEDRLGSLQPGHQADVVLFDGEPLEHTTRVCEVFIAGERVSEDCQ